MSAVQEIQWRQPKIDSQYTLELIRLIRAAQKDDANIPALTKYFDENPDLFVVISKIPIIAQVGLIEKMTAEAAYSLSMLEECKTKKRQLLAVGDSIAEDLLAQNVVLCWLRLQYAEIERNAAINTGCSIKYIEYIDRALTRAQNRFTRAVESLARVRALLKQ